MQQLKVTTYRGGKLNKIDKIIKCLENYPEGATPKMIALATRINVNTIKSMIQEIPEVKKIIRGLYKVVKQGDTPHLETLHNWTFHNLILTANLTNYKPITKTEGFGLITYRFTISKAGKASLIVACDQPLNIASIGTIFAWFKSQIPKENKLTTANTYINTIEFNKDYKNIRLDGVKALTIDSLTEQFKLYEKKTKMRIEHKTKVNFTVENIIDMLTNNPNSLELNIKLSAQQEQLNKLTTATNKTSDLLFTLIDNLKRNQE